MSKLPLSLLLAFVAVFPATAAAKPPEWLKQLESIPLPDHDAEVNAVALLIDQDVTVLPDGSVRYRKRHAYRILRRTGQAFGVARVDLGKNDELLGMQGWSIPTTGKPFESDRHDIVESAAGSDTSLVTDRRTQSLDIPAANPGNLVGYEIEWITHAALLDEQWVPRNSIPVLRARFRLRLPPGWTYSASWRNGTSSAPRSTEPDTWQWEMTNLDPIKAEPHAPPFAALAETLRVTLQGPTGGQSSFRDWNEMGAWFNAQLKGRSEAGAALVSRVAAVSAKRATLFEKTKALAELAQKDVRYVSIALGDAGYQPRQPAEVLQTGFGDCKDKANFLRVMLREIGVESHMVLVNTERGIMNADSMAALAFNHAVIAIRLPAEGNARPFNGAANIDDGKGGKLLLFDPTDTLTPFGRIGDQLRANTVLLVLPDSAHLVGAPAGSPADNGVDRFVTMKLAVDGTLSGDVREVWSGTWANNERERMLAAGIGADLIKPLEDRLSESIANYHIDHAVIESLKAIEKPFEWRYTLTAREYARKAGDLLMVRPRVLGSKVDRFLETDQPRRNPVAFAATHRDSDTMRIELPPDYVVESVPDPVKLDIQFATYHSSVRIDGAALVYERVFEQKALDLPATETDKLKEFYRAIARDEREMAVLKKKTTP